MPNIKHILFPLDFSAAGMATIPYVRALANQLHARVTVLSVVPPAWVTPPGLIPPPAGSDPTALQNSLQAHLDSLPMDGLESPPGAGDCSGRSSGEDRRIYARQRGGFGDASDARSRIVSRPVAGFGDVLRFCTTCIARCGQRRTLKSSTHKKSAQDPVRAGWEREEPGAGAMGGRLQPPDGRGPAVVARGADHQRLAVVGKRAVPAGRTARGVAEPHRKRASNPADWTCRCASRWARLWPPSPKKRGRKARI